MGGAYDYELLDALKSIAKSAERAAAALEKLLPPGGQDRGADKVFSIRLSSHSSVEDRKNLTDTIRAILTEQVQASSSRQQLCPTEHTPSRGEELLSGEPDQQSGRSPHP